MKKQIIISALALSLGTAQMEAGAIGRFLTVVAAFGLGNVSAKHDLFKYVGRTLEQKKAGEKFWNVYRELLIKLRESQIETADEAQDFDKALNLLEDTISNLSVFDMPLAYYRQKKLAECFFEQRTKIRGNQNKGKITKNLEPSETQQEA